MSKSNGLFTVDFYGKRNFLRRQAAVIIANHIGNETFNHCCCGGFQFHFLNEVDLVYHSTLNVDLKFGS